MALEYAKKYPQNVSHVVMIGIAPGLSAAHAAEAARYWDESVSPGRKRVLADNIAQLPDEVLAKLTPGVANTKRYVRNGPKAWFDPHFDSSPLWVGVEMNMDMFGHVWGKLFQEFDITKGLGELHAPVFVALGRYDFLVAPPSSWDPIRQRFRNLTIRVFERTGHTPQYEEPELFDAELLRWMKEKT